MCSYIGVCLYTLMNVCVYGPEARPVCVYCRDSSEAQVAVLFWAALAPDNTHRQLAELYPP